MSPDTTSCIREALTVNQRFRTALGDTRSLRSDQAANIELVDGLRRSFLRHLKAAGKAETTIRRYDLVLHQYVERSIETGYPWPPTREHVSDFFAGQRDAGKAKSTVRNSHVALRAFVNWLVDEGEIPEKDDPMRRLKTPPLDLHSPDPYSDDDIRAMLAASRGRHWTDFRDVAIVAVLADTGLRASEFCGLTIDSVELDAESIRVIGKGGRERRVGLGSSAQQHVDRYLRKRPRGRAQLWLSRTGTPITANGLYQIIKRITSAAGVIKPGVHRFRHYAATAMVRRGMSEMDLRAYMGWSDSAMAQRYTKHQAQERALSAHKRYSPLDAL